MEVISQKIVKTNKPHNCWGCMKLFPKGTEMQTVVSVDMDEISRVYWCEHCQEELDRLDPRDCQDGFLFGDLLNDDYYREQLTEAQDNGGK